MSVLEIVQVWVVHPGDAVLGIARAIFTMHSSVGYFCHCFSGRFKANLGGTSFRMSVKARCVYIHIYISEIKYLNEICCLLLEWYIYKILFLLTRTCKCTAQFPCSDWRKCFGFGLFLILVDMRTWVLIMQLWLQCNKVISDLSVDYLVHATDLL